MGSITRSVILLLATIVVSCDSQTNSGDDVPEDPRVKLISGDAFFWGPNDSSYSMNGATPLIKLMPNVQLHSLVKVSSEFMLKGKLYIWCTSPTWGVKLSDQDTFAIYEGTNDSVWYPISFQKDIQVAQNIYLLGLPESLQCGYSVEIKVDSVFSDQANKFLWLHSSEARGLTRDSAGFDADFFRYITLDTYPL